MHHVSHFEPRRGLQVMPLQESQLSPGFQLSKMLHGVGHLRHMVLVSRASHLSSLLSVDDFPVEFIVRYLDAGVNLLNSDAQVFFDFGQILKHTRTGSSENSKPR